MSEIHREADTSDRPEARESGDPVTSAFGRNGPRNTLTVLGRLVQRKPQARPLLDKYFTRHLAALAETALEVVVETGGPAGDALADAVETQAGFDLAERIMVRFESRHIRSSPALRRCGLAVTRKVLEGWEARDERTVRRAAKLCYLWHNLGFWLQALGETGDAMLAAQKALAWAKSLVEHKPERYRLRHAICLETYGRRLANAGRIAESLDPHTKAIEILRDLAAEEPENREAVEELSRTMLSQSIALKELRRFEDALVLAREVVEIRRRLAARSVSFEREQANSLDHLARCLSACALEQESLEAAREAAKIYKRLAYERPGAVATDLARCLANLCIAERSAGNLEDSLAASHEALLWIERAEKEWEDLPAPLEQYRPSIFVNEGLALLRARQPEKALEVIDEAIGIRRSLTQVGSPAARDRLALALFDRSIILASMDRREEALSSMDEAIRIRRELAVEEPAVYAETLSRSLRFRERIASRRFPRQRS